MILVKKLFIVLCLSVLMSGCASIPQQPPMPIVQDSNLITLCESNNVNWYWDSLTHIVTLKYGEQKARVLIGSDTVFIGDEIVLLNRPVTIFNSTIIVPSDFRKRVIKILKVDEAPLKPVRLPKRIKEIIIDAGHGGKDPGAIGRTGVYEKDVVLDICKRLYTILKKDGFKVKLTRKDDTFITLQKRTEIASQSKADLFVSIHANANTKRSIHGFETYILRDLDALEKKEAQRRKNHRYAFKNLAMKRNNSNVNAIVSDMMYTHKQKETKKLADYVGKTTSRAIRAKNRGTKRARFYVLRNTLIPAVLIEVGYLSNPKEEKLLKSGYHRQKVAMGIAKSIREYINGGK